MDWRNCQPVELRLHGAGERTHARTQVTGSPYTISECSLFLVCRPTEHIYRRGTKYVDVS